MAVPEPSSAEYEAARKEMEHHTRSMLVLLDGMIHQAQGLNVPPNVVFMVMEGYIIQLKRRMTELYGADMVAELEKGSEMGSKLWFKVVEDESAKPKPVAQRINDPMYA